MEIGRKQDTIALNMRPPYQHLGSTAAVLFSKTQQALLSLFFTRPDQAFYYQETVRLVELSKGTVYRELKRMHGAGILTRTRQGNQVYYQANPDCPVYRELIGLITKTAGVADVLAAALGALVEKIKVAFIFGSFAKGEPSSRSDVDVMIIGDVKFGDMVSAIAPAQSKLAREINPVVYPPKEFQGKLAADHTFLSNVINGPKIFIIGDERELAAVAG